MLGFYVGSNHSFRMYIIKKRDVLFLSCQIQGYLSYVRFEHCKVNGAKTCKARATMQHHSTKQVLGTRTTPPTTSIHQDSRVSINLPFHEEKGCQRSCFPNPPAEGGTGQHLTATSVETGDSHLQGKGFGLE